MTVLLDLEALREEYESMIATSRGRTQAEQQGYSWEPTRYRERPWRGEQEELWRQQYQKSAILAAEWGRLTRLPEHVVMQQRQQKQPTPKTTPAALPPVNPRQIVEAAARAGAASKLPEKVVCNYPEKVVYERQQQEEEEEDEEEYEEATLTEDASVLVVPVPPGTTIPAVQQLLRTIREQRNEYALRPMVELSAQAAQVALQKRMRLDRHFGGVVITTTSSIVSDEKEEAVRIRRRCDCSWCRSSSSSVRGRAPPEPIPSQPNHRKPTKSELSRAVKVVDLSSRLPVETKERGKVDDDDSSGYTEITVSTHDEQFYPVIEITEMDRRTSDVTFEEASLLSPVKPKMGAPAKDHVASTSPPSTGNTDPTSPTTQSSSSIASNAAKSGGKGATPPSQRHVATATAAPPKDRSCGPGHRNAHPSMPVGRHKPVKPLLPPSHSTGHSQQAAPPRPTPPSQVRHRPRRHRELPHIEYLIVTRPEEDVSSLSMPGYFDDAVERAILEQMRMQAGVAEEPSTKKQSSCVVTRFLQTHLAGHR